MYDAENYVLTDAVKANVTELYFGRDADRGEQAKLILRIYRDCNFLKEKLNELEDERDDWRRKYIKLKYEKHKEGEES